MKTKDIINTSLKKIFRNKKNRYYMIALVALNILLLFNLSFKSNINNYLEETMLENISFRTIIVNPILTREDYGLKDLKNTKNIVFAESLKYLETGVYSSFKNKDYDGSLNLVIGNKYTLPKNIYGSTFNDGDTNVAICPIDFYPSSESSELFVKNSLIMNGKKMLNKTFDAYYYTYKIENNEPIVDKKHTKTFKIIGVYNHEETGYYGNYCFVPFNDLKEIDDNQSAVNTIGVEGLYGIIDKNENADETITALKNQGFTDASIQFEIDTNLISKINTVFNIITIIIVGSLILIIFFYLKKKVINDTESIGILRSIGYSKLTIYKMYIIEILITNLISFIIATLLLLIIYILIMLFIVNPYINKVINVKIFLKDFVFPILLSVIMPLLIVIFYITMIVNNKIVSLAEKKD